VTEQIAKGSWVEIHRVLLAAGERAPHIPEDTRKVPLEMRVKGFLLEPAALGAEARIETPAGRTLGGTLVRVNPPYDHSFGPPLPELSAIGPQLRALLHQQGDGDEG
jgi:hypothetical protein